MPCPGVWVKLPAALPVGSILYASDIDFTISIFLDIRKRLFYLSNTRK